MNRDSHLQWAVANNQYGPGRTDSQMHSASHLATSLLDGR